jgi:predicted amidohydrolase YtcJ
MGSVAKTGARLAMGSDWNVSSVNPLEAIQTAVTRRGIRDTTGLVLVPEEAVDLMTALRAYTLGSAWALGLDDETGSLREGKAADLIILDDNITAIPVTSVHAMKVLLTMVEGVAVHGSLDLNGGAR